ncbi:MAG: YeiH family protein [Chloroflexi bacterium]|nr:YeiH family protein [Chloroflexota bacterium]MDA8187074.1 putative sulfate exporter family transporter [Dehalococcoidales bacterium]
MSGQASISQSRVMGHLGVWQQRTPGLLLVLLLAVPAKIIGDTIPVVPDVVIALVAGIIVSNLVFRVTDTYRPGVRFSQKTVLQAAIVLMGGSLSFAAVLQIGAQALGVIILCFVISFSLGALFARGFSLPGKVGTLLGSGTAICGATAIITVGPLIAATEEEIAYAVTTIFSFNILAILIYPVLGHLFHFSDLAFGTWSGTSVNDTSAVIATSYIFSNGAGAIATVVKLTRTLLLVPLAVGVGFFAALRGRQQNISVLKMVPWFVFGFAGMAVLNSLGLLPGDLPKALTALAKFLIVMVLAAVGLNVDVARMRSMGPKPFVSGMLLAGVMSALSLGILRALSII